MNKIHEILDQLYYEYRWIDGAVTPAKGSTDGKDHPTRMKMKNNLTIDQAEAAIAALIEQIIGIDDVVQFGFDINPDAAVRNALRQEQRARANNDRSSE